MNINLIFSNVSFFIFLFTGTFADWHYEKNDKEEWIDEYPECNGVLQSPINIETKNAVFTSTLEPIHFINYDFELLFNLTNNGHTIVAFQADPLKNVRPFITGSDFGSEIFYLSQFHFHWGYDVSLGSEHHIDNKTFPLEMHLVHQSDTGNITVVSFLFEITPKDNPNLNRLLKLIGEDVYENASSSSYMRLTEILPNVKSANSKGYFRYLGSLTTPPCTEGVIWNVYRETIKISIKQLKNFYKNSIKFNYRPVQSLNSRRLFVNAKLKN